MQYFITNIKDNKITDKNLIHQIWRVLRSKVWDKLYFIDWNWKKQLVEITWFSKKEIDFEIIRTQIEKQEDRKIIRLFQVLPKAKSKWEFILQKATELWVSEFVPVRSKFSQAKYASWSERDKIIVKEACEQSQWLYLAKINELEEFLNIFKKYSWVFYFFDSSNQSLKTQFELGKEENNEINIIIWAEWGFTKEEVRYAKNQENCVALSLWNKILRLETAVIVALARINID